MNGNNTKSRIESQEEIKAYIQNLNYALDQGTHIEFQEHRLVDDEKPIQYRNSYTISTLFPDENPVDVLRKELRTLSVDEYICTVEDLRFPKRSEMREFGRVYNGTEDVFIKIRVEVLGLYGNSKIFVMSFHFAETPFRSEIFPYRTSTEV